jgi:hypothetical protein
MNKYLKSRDFFAYIKDPYTSCSGISDRQITYPDPHCHEGDNGSGSDLKGYFGSEAECRSNKSFGPGLFFGKFTLGAPSSA